MAGWWRCSAPSRCRLAIQFLVPGLRQAFPKGGISWTEERGWEGQVSQEGQGRQRGSENQGEIAPAGCYAEPRGPRGAKKAQKADRGKERGQEMQIGHPLRCVLCRWLKGSGGYLTDRNLLSLSSLRTLANTCPQHSKTVHLRSLMRQRSDRRVGQAIGQ